MKRLIIVNGTMGVGKTATCQELAKILPANVFLDGDWCWNTTPFVVTEETKAMAMRNITYLLNSFLSCSVLENILFCWVIHREEILKEIMDAIAPGSCRLHTITLTCSREALEKRLRKDIEDGKRSPDIVQRSIERLPLYHGMNTFHMDVGENTPVEAANRIAEYIRAC